MRKVVCLHMEGEVHQVCLSDKKDFKRKMGVESVFNSQLLCSFHFPTQFCKLVAQPVGCILLLANAIHSQLPSHSALRRATTLFIFSESQNLRMSQVLQQCAERLRPFARSCIGEKIVLPAIRLEGWGLLSGSRW